MTPRTAAPHPSPQDLRAALGRFATGVTIVTTRAVDGSPVGLTVNSFNSVSLQPALVLWSLALRSNTLPVFRQAQHFAIHVLAASQRDLALRFATPGIDRWAGVEHQPSPTGVPLLAGGVARFECRQHSQHTEGDHLIFVGAVERCEHRADARPLLYHGGRFYTEHPL